MNGNSVEKLKELINGAGAIVIGAGAGLSSAAGYLYSGERFRKYFGDFEDKYGFHDMYTGGFYQYDTPEESWAYWSRYIFVNRYMPVPLPVYGRLLDIVKDKDYFVITTNVDHCFQRAGFDKKRLFYTQGDFGLFQCSVPCHDKTYDNEEMIRQMVETQKNMKVPFGLYPRCPKCGKPMTVNLRADDTFVQDEGWEEACARYVKFIEEHKGGRVLFLELGVGYNTPAIIKFPFIRMTADNENAHYVCVNKGEVYIPKEIEERAIGIDGDIYELLKAL